MYIHNTRHASDDEQRHVYFILYRKKLHAVYLKLYKPPL